MNTAAVSEFRRPVRLDELENGEVHRTVEAGDEERTALARRFDVVAIDALAASVRVRRVSGGPLVRVEGRLTADVVQRCVVTLEPLPVHIEEDFAETFGPDGYRAPGGGEDTDVPEVFDDSGIDLGELAAQLLSLSLDPYPRAPGTGVLRQPGAGEDAGERRTPFAVLGELMQKQRK
ncbi:MAG: DUF177 domain-containing protein [Alphaproteobacteria bacterium]|nr:DUF177 domain-containing protein [Alphaproteobacteria bacterium]